MLKFLLKLVLKLYFDLVSVGRLHSYPKMANEGVKPEVGVQKIADFYRKNVSKGKFYTWDHFKRIWYNKTQVYDVMREVDAGESLETNLGKNP